MLKLEIVTPEKKLVDTEADSVTVPTASGDVGLLPNHAPLISALRPGVLSYTTRNHTERIAVTGGFVEISDDNVLVLADAADTVEDIDAAAVKRERDEAEKQLGSTINQPVEEFDEIRDRLEAANARLQLTAGK